MRNTDSLTYGFIGIGLIGGSVAKALRRVYPGCKIIVYNRGAKPRVMACLLYTSDLSSIKL